MRFRTFQTLLDAVGEAAVQEHDRGNMPEWERLSKLVLDICRADEHFRRLRLRYLRYLDRRSGKHHSLVHRGPSPDKQNKKSEVNQ